MEDIHHVIIFCSGMETDTTVRNELKEKHISAVFVKNNTMKEV